MQRLPALVSLLALAAVAGVGLGLAQGGSGRALAAATGQTPQSPFTATLAGEVTTAEIETTPIETLRRQLRRKPSRPPA